MGIRESLQARRSYYQIDETLPVSEDTVRECIEQLTELVPDAFNMKSARVVIAFGEAHRGLWDDIFDVFDGKVSREKIDVFRSGAGTVLYFYDEQTVKGLQEQFPRYADNFPIWAQQANGMLQLSVWTALRELGVGANLQHYNPVIDEVVRKRFDLPAEYRLVAQMPFGGIASEPAPKEPEDISKRVLVF